MPKKRPDAKGAPFVVATVGSQEHREIKASKPRQRGQYKPLSLAKTMQESKRNDTGYGNNKNDEEVLK